jgi:hypothetical protein
MLDVDQLENVRRERNRLRAACPACRAGGADKTGNHLRIEPDGSYGCAAAPGDGDHRKLIFALVGLRPEANPSRPVVARVAPPLVEKERKPFRLPDLRTPTVTELDQIRTVRRWPYFGPLESLAREGILGAATVPDGASRVEAWFITDPAHRAAQGRRLDGAPWQSIDAKAKTWPGSQANWPIGAARMANNDDPVFVTEGGPDMLAVVILAWLAEVRIRPIAMLGAGQRIHPDAVPLFFDRRVRIVEQADAPAVKAGMTWAGQLQEIGAVVDGWAPPAGVKDVADLLASFPHEDLDADPATDHRRRAIETELFSGI